MKSDHKDFFEFIQEIRDFFRKKDFLDIPAPPLVENPGMEAHLHPFEVYTSQGNSLEKKGYLHTSPEFFMKELLSHGLEKIFTLGHCFRNEPHSENHRPQFLMLEWYRTNQTYSKIIDDCQELISYLSGENIKIRVFSVREIFEKFTDIDFYEHRELSSFLNESQKKFPHLNINSDYSWDDIFFVLFLNLVEPKLKSLSRFIILKDYPASMAALSKIHSDDGNICKRFELFIDGVEIANCFEELTDSDEQIKRFKREEDLKNKLYNQKLPWPKNFLKTLERGLPESSGIALGVERLYALLREKKTFSGCYFHNP